MPGRPLRSGVTVLTGRCAAGLRVNVMGGAPGTRETELLAPDKLVQAVDALVLSGGSAFGLAACDGVIRGAARHGAGAFRSARCGCPSCPAPSSSTC
jgi:L-aminopeptidase/D-esterase-like protein